MSATVMSSLAEADLGEVTPEFKIVVMYEDCTLGAVAMELCEELMTKFHNSFLFRLAVGSFAALEDEAKLDQSASTAAEADVILVASAGELPTTVRWFNRFLASRRSDRPGVLVDMTPDTSTHAQEVHELLRNAAKAHHLDLISKEQFACPTVTATTSSVRRSDRGDICHWGINE